MANYSAALRDINSPSSSYYVVPADGAMSCDVLRTNAKTLTDQIEMWVDKLNSANNKEMENISQIIPIQQSKLDRYNEALVKCQSGTGDGAGNGNGETLPPPAPSPAPKNNTALWVGGGLLAALFILKKNKKL